MLSMTIQATSIDQTVTNSAPHSKTDDQTAAIPSGPTVFVGNLPFTTSPEQVTHIFGVDKVQSVRLIKKFGRFKGYGFVSFYNQKDADQAIVEWDGKESYGRELKVQPATAPKPIAPKPVAAPKPAAAPKSVDPNADPSAVAPGEKKKRKPRKPKKRVDDSAAPAAEEVAVVESEGEKTAAPKKKRQPRRKPAAALVDGEPAPAAPPARKPRGDRPLSKTALFVGNLPFEVDDDDLRGLFGEFKVESARVVRYNERSKGFGFVYFADEKNCADAKVEFEGALLESRALIIKAAFQED